MTNEMGTNEMGTNEMGTNEMGTNEMDTNEMDTNEMGTNEMGTNEMGTNEMGTNEMDIDENTDENTDEDENTDDEEDEFPTIPAPQNNNLENIRARNRLIFETLNNFIADAANIVTEEDNLARAIDESLRTAQAYKQTISEKGISDIKVVQYDSTIHQNEQCPITLEDISKTDEVIGELPCKHIALHNELISWLKENPVCPICRHKMDSIEEKIVQNTNDNTDNTNNNNTVNTNNEVDIPSPPPHPTQQSLDNYPTQSTILNTLLYLNYNDDTEIVNQRNSFMRNLNTLNRINR